MTITVQQLTGKLNEFPANSVISITDVDETELFIVSFDHKGNGLTILVSEEENESEEAGE
ncbi:hypothetical protein [Nostoc sp. NMS4]|uniref:hypothetical protein n=1 Tax=Nostoc sp. NMS4 TaxID=2815390 RepID=UPI0025E48ADA|nr:hypothetical protein [Nostoc sp. NMS4]MBN3924021.1 hypothetical protein [Nostoc sp. NMS4]